MSWDISSGSIMMYTWYYSTYEVKKQQPGFGRYFIEQQRLNCFIDLLCPEQQKMRVSK